MYQCWIENEYGERLELTNNKNYTVYQIDGLNPTDATINTTPVANFDGSRFNSSRTNERNIVIYLTIEGDCETNRINLYRYVKTKRYVKFYYKNATRDVYIEGYVESMPIAIFEMKQNVQISILCPQPFFKAHEKDIIDFSSLTPMFVFPFAYEKAGAPFSAVEIAATQSIINKGDVENGVIIQIQATGRALNPQIYNLDKNEYFKIDLDMVAGDLITINTSKSQKQVTLLHDGIETNIINDMRLGSSWFQLLTGDNVFTYGADEYPENLTCKFIHVNEFEGV